MFGGDAKDFDKFYTHPEIAQRFVSIVNQYSPLKEFDLVVEPAAGCGYILQHLPSNAI